MRWRKSIRATCGINRVRSGTDSIIVHSTHRIAFPAAAILARAVLALSNLLSHVGDWAVEDEHVPANDSEDKLSAAHTRLLLKRSRRMFLWALGAAIENVRNEETAAAGAIPAEAAGGRTRGSSKHHLRGFEGLGPKKADLSRYKHVLTEKQQMAFSLKLSMASGRPKLLREWESTARRSLNTLTLPIGKSIKPIQTRGAKRNVPRTRPSSILAELIPHHPTPPTRQTNSPSLRYNFYPLSCQ